MQARSLGQHGQVREARQRVRQAARSDLPGSPGDARHRALKVASGSVPGRPDERIARLGSENQRLEAQVRALKIAQLDSLALLAENQRLKRVLRDVCWEVWHCHDPKRASVFHEAEHLCSRRFCDDPGHDEALDLGNQP